MINNNSTSTFLNLSELFLPKIVPLATIVISAKSKKNSIPVDSQADKEAKAVHKVTKTKVKTRVVSKSSERKESHKDKRWKNDIISRVIQLERELGGCAPGLLDLLCCFSREEIHAVWDQLSWLYGPDFGL